MNEILLYVIISIWTIFVIWQVYFHFRCKFLDRLLEEGARLVHLEIQAGIYDKWYRKIDPNKFFFHPRWMFIWSVEKAIAKLKGEK